MQSSKNIAFEALENRALRSVSLPVDLGSLVSQTVGTSASSPSAAISGTHGVVATTQRGVGLLDGSEIYAQRVDAIGNMVGAPIHVNQASLGDQTDPKVAIANDGSFVVSYLSGNAAYVRQFAADGTPLGAEQRVSGLLDNATDTNIAKGTDGKFLVTYVTNNVTTGKDVYSRLFNADGTPATAATLLNTNPAGDQLAPAIAALPGGQYVTAFQSNIGDGQGFNIVMQRISNSGAALGANMIVNDITAGDQLTPDLAYNSALNEIGLVYQTTSNDNGDIAEQLFNADGTVKRPSQIVNSTTAGLQKAPKLAFTNAGTQAVTYLTDHTGTNPTGTLTMLDGNGLLLGDTDLGNLNNSAAGIPVAGGASSGLLTMIANGTNTSPEVSAEQISIKPLEVLGTSQNDTVVVLPGVGSLTITVNGVTTNPLLGDFSQINISTGLGSDSVTVANLLSLLGNIAVNVNGGDGNDTLTTGDTSDTLLGGTGDDILNGGAGADQLMGGDGNDALDGGAGNDFLWDTVGTDTIRGGDGIDTVSFAGLSGNARIVLDGTAVSGVIGQFDTLAADIENAVGGSGNDTIIGNDLNNILSGGIGNDTIDGGLGADIIDGGAGVDTVSYASRTLPVSIVLNGSAISGVAGELDQVSGNIENAIGGAGDDSMTGNGLANLLLGGDGNDTIFAGNGNDILVGGNGNDNLSGESGRDLLAGQAGNDTINGGHGSDRLAGDAGNDFIMGGPGNDSVDAGDGADRVNGGSGNDIIEGNTGNDSLFGDTGADTLQGDDGNDILFGGTGRDSLIGNSGDDVLYGQTGQDTLDGGEGTDILNGGASRDNYYTDALDKLVSVELKGA